MPPQFDNSCYLNRAADPKDRYLSYFFRDLLPEVQSRDRARTEPPARAVAGVSMGGYGTRLLALRRPQAISFAAEFSGCLDLMHDPDLVEAMKPFELDKLLGPPEGETRQANDVMALVETVDPAALPYLWLTAGENDFLFDQTLAFAQALRKRILPIEFHTAPATTNGRCGTASCRECSRRRWRGWGPSSSARLTYDTAVGFGGGKVAISKTWTYWSVAGTPNTEKVTETYQYQGLGGKISHRLTAVYNNGVLLHSFNQAYAFRDFGALASLDYPQMNSLPSPRSISLGYKNGFLTGAQPYTGTVPGQASGRGITYHPNQMLSQLAYGNGALETIAIDSTAMRRPTSISYSGILSGPTWSSGTYAYDGSGNIKAIGADRFSYDGVGRLDQSKVFAGSTQTQDYTYDAYGNLTNTTTNGVGVPSPANPATNRLSSQTYDGRGNQTGYNGALYLYDELNRMLEMRNGTQDWFFLYDGADERLASYCVNAGCGVGTIRWTVRGLDQQILREYIEGGGNTLSVLNDYVYANGQLLASETPAGVRDFHPDHLGTPRLVSDGGGNGLVAHTYFPYGQEATSPTGDAQRLKFTAQERDLFATTGANPAADDLDYFHARVRSPLVGRFLSVDPVQNVKRTMKRPQGWNRYSFVVGNPMKYVDPTGTIFVLAGCESGGNQEQCNASKALLQQALGDSYKNISIGKNGELSLTGISASDFGKLGTFQKGLGKLIGDKSTFTLFTGSSPEAKAGGGGQTVGIAGGGANIYVDPAAFASGKTMTGDVLGTAVTTLVHETGHALATLYPGLASQLTRELSRSPFVTDHGEAYPVTFENRYRHEAGLEIRASYGGLGQDVLIDNYTELVP
ncbi:MAG: RHS repeat-associated core domain-containing protein [Thermoanaerobaculia bacterium]